MRSHFFLNRGVMAACAAAGTAVVGSHSAAQTILAADYATNATYIHGWSAGQNGGFGFGPWSMDNTSTNDLNEFAMDRTSPFDPFHVAWTLFNPEGRPPAPGNSPGGNCVNGPVGTDVCRAGRACAPLTPGETFTTVIASPTTRAFYRGYTIRLVTGSDNTMYGNAGTQIAVGTFEYFSYGQWYTTMSYPTGRTTLFDTDTAAGMQLDVTMTSTNTYHLVMTPLANPANAYAEDGTLITNGPINWLEFEVYNTDSDFYPGLAPCGPDPTDFYVQSMAITSPLTIRQAGANVILTWPTNYIFTNLYYATNLSGAQVWQPVQPQPSVVNGNYVVTNALNAAKARYYRLSP